MGPIGSCSGDAVMEEIMAGRPLPLPLSLWLPLHIPLFSSPPFPHSITAHSLPLPSHPFFFPFHVFFPSNFSLFFYFLPSTYSSHSLLSFLHSSSLFPLPLFLFLFPSSSLVSSTHPYHYSLIFLSPFYSPSSSCFTSSLLSSSFLTYQVYHAFPPSLFITFSSLTHSRFTLFLNFLPFHLFLPLSYLSFSCSYFPHLHLVFFSSLTLLSVSFLFSCLALSYSFVSCLFFSFFYLFITFFYFHLVFSSLSSLSPSQFLSPSLIS